MMKKKLNCILLVDDNDADNYYHEIVINDFGCAEEVVAVQSGKAALDYLKSIENGNHPQPDLIFLDINMPAMNGWEFLEEYKKLDVIQQGKIVVVMLTTSLNLDDEEKARGIEHIKNFKNKPLTEEMLHEIIEKHFPENF